MPEPRDVYLHLGLTKTGTTYLQDRLRADVQGLEAQGLRLIPRQVRASVAVARAIRGALPPEENEHVLARFVERIERGDTPRVLYTEETVAATASPERIQHLGELLAGHRLHLLLTVRDIGRALPSVWQQRVRGGATPRFERFVHSATRGPGTNSGYWTYQDTLTYLRRWSAITTPERCTVIAVPPSGAPKDELLSRFCRAVDVDPARLDLGEEPPSRRTNAAFGLVQTEVLRRLNEVLSDDAKERETHRRFVRDQIGFGALAGQGGRSPKITAEHEDAVRAFAQQLIDGIHAEGYRLIGEATDLLPAREAFTDEPIRVDDGEVAEAAVAALASVIERQVARRAKAQVAKETASEETAAEESSAGA